MIANVCLFESNHQIEEIPPMRCRDGSLIERDVTIRVLYGDLSLDISVAMKRTILTYFS
jgi:hypothetical protein